MHAAYEPHHEQGVTDAREHAEVVAHAGHTQLIDLSIGDDTTHYDEPSRQPLHFDLTIDDGCEDSQEFEDTPSTSWYCFAI